MKLNLSVLTSGDEWMISVEVREAATADPKLYIQSVHSHNIVGIASRFSDFLVNNTYVDFIY